MRLPGFIRRAYASQGWFPISRCPECDGAHRAFVYDKPGTPDSPVWFCFRCKHGGTFIDGNFRTLIRPDLQPRTLRQFMRSR